MEIKAGNKWRKRTDQLWPHVTILLLLLGLTALVNRNVQISGLYQDDLYVWDVYSSHRPLDYIFLTGSSRFRPVWNLISCVIFKLTGPHTEWLIPVHIAVNSLIAWMVYGIGSRWSKSRVIGFLMGIAYVISRFSYYQIQMALGMMEAFSLAGALLLLYCLIEYLNADQDAQAFAYGYAAVLVYLLTVFTHERYMVLVLLLAAVFFGKKDWRRLGVSIAAFVFIQLVRLWAIGTISPPGTGHTTVAETFQLGTALGYAWSQVMYLFGINAGPDYLCGIPWEHTQLWIKALVFINMVILTLLCLLAAFCVLNIKKQGKNIASYMGCLAVMAGFIALCIGGSSVTVRVEMRWVYVSYSAALCVLAYLYGLINSSAVLPDRAGKCGKGCKILAVGLTVLYVTLLIPIEGYYRDFRDQMYYYNGQKEMNSLADETWFYYGEELFEKKLYVLQNKFEIADYTWDTVFRVFHPRKQHAVPEVQVISDVRELGLIEEHMVILAEDEKDHSYLNITDYVRRQKLDRLEGYYEDDWSDRRCRFLVQAGGTGRLIMSGDFPGQLKGGETTAIKAVQQETGETLTEEIIWTANQIDWELKLEPYEIYEISMESNFEMEHAREQRGDTPLAFFLHLKVK